MKVKLIGIIVIILFTLFCLTTISNGASASISASSRDVKVGDVVTIYINVSAAASWDLNVSYSGLTLQSGATKIVDTSNSGDNVSQQVQTLTFKANSAGQYIVSLSGLVVSENFESASAGGSVTINVTEPVTTPPNNGGNNSENQNNSGPKSNNASLTGMTVSVGELAPPFNKNTKSYTVHVGSDVTEINISATKEDSKSTYSVSGNKDLQVGENTVTVTVTAEDGTKNTYKITVIRAEKIVMKLSSLTIKGLTLTPEFNPEVFEYTLELTEFMKELDIKAVAENENTPVEIVGGKDLHEGENVILIILKSADGSETTEYRITIIVPEEVLVEEKEETKEEEEEKTSIFGGIFTRPSNNILAAIGVGIMTIGTIIMLIIEKYKEYKREQGIDVENISEYEIPNAADIAEIPNYEGNDIDRLIEDRKGEDIDLDHGDIKTKNKYETMKEKIDILTSTSIEAYDKKKGKRFM